jgi:very-short-patch-repair endonuclease
MVDGIAGLPRIRPLVLERLADGWTPPESELEALLFGLLDRLPEKPHAIRQAGLPSPGRVDLLLPDHRLIVEADGRRWHTRVADFDRDTWRDNQATANGYGVLRFTWVHLHHLTDDVLGLVGTTLHRRSSLAS